MAKHRDIKLIVGDMMSMLGVIALVVSFGSLPKLLLYRPEVSPIRCMLGILIGALLLGISNFGVLRTPVHELIKTIMNTALVVSFMTIASIGDHAMRRGLVLPSVEIPLLLVAFSVLIAVLTVYRSKRGRRIRKYLRT